jgi:hypothetical protein
MVRRLRLLAAASMLYPSHPPTAFRAASLSFRSPPLQALGVDRLMVHVALNWSPLAMTQAHGRSRDQPVRSTTRTWGPVWRFSSAPVTPCRC